MPPTNLGREIRFGAPATEAELSNFDLELTPTAEVMQAAQQLTSVLSDPASFAQWTAQVLRQPNGEAALGAVYSDIMARGQSQQLATAINDAFSTPTVSQTFGAQVNLPVGGAPTAEDLTLPYTAYAMAIVDQMTRGNLMQAGEATYWGMSGAGGQGLAEQVMGQLLALQVRLGCSDPLRATLRFAGQFASQQMTAGGAAVANASPSTLVANLQRVPSLWACFQDAYPNWQQLMTQGGMAGGAQTTGGAQMPTQPSTTTGTTQPMTTGTTTTGTTQPTTMGTPGTTTGGQP